MAQTITPVLLAGGSGTRLWPLSRRRFPKQFARLSGEETMFQAAIRRGTGAAFGPPVVLTAAPFRFVAAEQLAAMGADPEAILLEPEPRSTAPAILAAAMRAAPDDLLLVMPADHLVADADAFRADVAAAAAAARDGAIVLFGAPPDRPETGYGYIRATGPIATPAPAPLPVEGFVEKPDAATAGRLVAQGALWNAGIFLFRAGAFLRAVREAAPALMPPVAAALRGARADLGFLRLDPDAWSGVPDVSVDRAVMERTPALRVQPLRSAWADLGDWSALARQVGGGATPTQGAATAIDCEGGLLRTEGAGPRLVGLGLRDVVAVAMPDAVLVMDAARGQDVGAAVAALRDAGVPEADAFGREHRPWGWFDRLAEGEGFGVKRITVRPGGRLSLQSHRHRAEHWIVVSGSLRVTLEGAVRDAGPDASIYVPRGARHRLENAGPTVAVLIEVQTGPYLAEDDIVRYEDVYRRPEAGD
ncbi:mannose-1-phosphate guanylyltransferase/mannose-6-phosphate isomerase [Hasllibacter halocynthiae]|uniref:mannose-1-phosphate guanylyltransferase n=1 Tax=Hasllibacter halocynthiae TaxID=595589 RepID=A0A2T0X303_9RHOB|nr:mannose-1-phosphate guanylyltransferase/mannose-6-phosphate isomerase [Hasllibacter halocynthiae]PRY93320.1 mannose-1-phosphate guanylyltransferase/mannose-6-phosphate isomerase [Hasllibacter halocynthiae]